MSLQIGNGIITGSAAEDSSPKASCRISLYDRTTNKVIARTVSDSSGGYAINNIDSAVNDYYIIAVDDDGATKKNAMIYDYVQPVNGAVGSSYNKNWLAYMKWLNPVNFFGGTGLAPGYTDRTSSYSFNNGTTHSDAECVGGFILSSGTMTLTSQSSLLGATDLLVCNVTTGVVKSYAATTYCTVKKEALNIVAMPFTIFSVVDTTKSFKSGFPLESNNPIRGPGILYYNASTFTITMYVDNNGSSTPVLTYVIPSGAGRSGLHSIAVVNGASVNKSYTIYFDGVSVASSTITTSLYVYSASSQEYNNASLSHIEGLNTTQWSNTTNGTFSFVLDAKWYRVLTSNEIQTLHSYLFTVQAPIVTGYKKELLTDNVASFWELSDRGDNRIYDAFYGEPRQLDVYNKPVGNLIRSSFSDVTHVPTPVSAGTGINFDGSFICSNPIKEQSAGFAPSGFHTRALTLECWVNLNSTPTADAMLMTYGNNLAVPYHKFYITSAGLLSAVFSSVSSETFNFTHTALSTGTWYHIALVLDKVGLTCKLYINGSLADTKTASATPIYVVNAGASTSTSGLLKMGTFCVGGYMAQNGISNTINAKMYGVAVFNTALSAARIQAHYDSRTVA